MRVLLIIFGIVGLFVGIVGFINVASDIQIIIGLIGIFSFAFCCGLLTILDNVRRLDKRLTSLIGAENPKPVNPPQNRPKQQPTR